MPSVVKGPLCNEDVAVVETGVVAPLDFPEIRDLKLVLRQIHLDPTHIEDVPLLMACVPGIWGDGSNGSPDYYDDANSTGTKDDVNHNFS